MTMKPCAYFDISLAWTSGCSCKERRNWTEICLRKYKKVCMRVATSNLKGVRSHIYKTDIELNGPVIDAKDSPYERAKVVLWVCELGVG